MHYADQRNAFLIPVVFLLVLFAGAGFFGCSASPDEGDGGGGGGGTTTEITRGTIDSLIAVFFPTKYSDRDSIAYEEMLDDRYTFEKLPSEDDEPGEDLFWDKFEELRIAGRMFKGFTNPDGQSVESITTNIIVTDTNPSNDSDQPDDEDWFDVTAIVDMIVVVSDPSITDGTGVINFIINSNQEFIVTDDKDSPGDWVVVQQVDKEQIN